MSKVVLVYRIPDELEDFKNAFHGVDWKLVAWELDEWLRQKYKYEDQKTIDIEEVREKLSELMQERGVEH